MSLPRLTIIGSGCAGLSLARAIGQDKKAEIALITDKPATDRSEHIWGFWHMPWLDDAAGQATHKWHKWRFMSDDISVIHHSDEHPYHMLSSTQWLSYCTAQSGTKETISPITDTAVKDDIGKDTPQAPYFDSRPKPAPEGALLQHFLGQMLKTSQPVFDPSIATLMDFRCDQSQGLHFIYLLPTAPDTALIESTLFTDTPLQDAFYEEAIKRYMTQNYPGIAYDVTRTEKGIIPLADCRDTKAPNHAIGARGGALRPSSGYAFTFIQKQVAEIIAHHDKTGTWRATSPLSARDLWMDKVFLRVLSKHPTTSARLFMRLAKALTGTEFACFMSGTARWPLIAKIIFAMPKLTFISAALAVIAKGGRA